MKERKLLIFCLSFLIGSFLGIHFFGAYLGEVLKKSKIEEMIPPGSQVEIVGQVYRKEEASNYQILYLKNISIMYQNQSIKESRIIIYDKDENTQLKIGNQIQVSGSLDFFESASNPGNFDQKFYYQKQRIHGFVWINTVNILRSPKKGLNHMLYELRRAWSGYLKKTAGEKYGSILSAMLLGEKSSMDADIKALYQVNGIAHILAISGLHLSFIGHGFYQIVRKGSGSYLAGGLVGLIFMTVYIMMIGVSVSALRAVVMFVLRVFADMSGRVYDTLTAVSLAAVVVVLWRPLSFYDGGFQLSFGAIAGVLFLNPLILNKNKDKSFLYNSIVTSVSIQIVTVPILLYHYYEIPLYSIWLNLIVIPTMSLVLVLAILSIMTGSVCEVLGWCLVQGDVWILEGYEWLCDYILELPNARIITGQPKLWGIMIYYLCMVCAMAHGYWVKNAKRKGIVFIGIWLAGGIALLASCPNPTSKELRITMLDVGQGDCFFIQQDKFTCLIDGGSSSESQIGKYRIEPFLKWTGTDELDYVFVSHGDTDHINGIQEMLERQREGIRIRMLVMPEQHIWDKSLWKLAEVARKNATKVVKIHKGDILKYGELRIKCLYPENNMNGMELGNETSMVLDVLYSDFSMLFTGDIEKNGEKKLTSLLEKKYDVLKIGHHGSRNSTSEKFLKKTKPKIGLISAGKDNAYGHPHKELLERLEQAKCKAWNTAESGAVSIKVTKTVAKLKVFQYNNCYEKFE